MNRPQPNWPLMVDNVTQADADAVRDFLAGPDLPILTQSGQVSAFEREWSNWLGVRHSVFVNSGSSANLITLAALPGGAGPGEIIMSPLTWVSDVAAVLQNGFEPVFVDIDRRTLGASDEQILARITPRTRAVFLTHVLGYSAVTPSLVEGLAAQGVPLIEDVCESHGATYRGRKLGTLGLMSNFSFYYAHHMSTIEGGMVSTDDDECYERLRMLRSHGLVREARSEAIKARYAREHADLNTEFVFAYPAYNVRSSELHAVIGRSQLRRLDKNNVARQRNLRLFLDRLDPRKYFVDFATEGSSNYALTLLLKEPNETLRDNVVAALERNGIEFRRGMSGGGNQLRQPYLRERLPEVDPRGFPEVDHVHFFGLYIGNYPSLEASKIHGLCELLNDLPTDRSIDRPPLRRPNAAALRAVAPGGVHA